MQLHGGRGSTQSNLTVFNSVFSQYFSVVHELYARPRQHWEQFWQHGNSVSGNRPAVIYGTRFTISTRPDSRALISSGLGTRVEPGYIVIFTRPPLSASIFLPTAQVRSYVSRLVADGGKPFLILMAYRCWCRDWC